MDPNLELTLDLEKLDKKINDIKKLLKLNDTDTAPTNDEDGIRVRRKTEADRAANRIAKMFLTLSAMNGYNDRRRTRCKDDYYDNGWNDGDNDGVDKTQIVAKKTPSSNEERYKVKKWIEELKSRRSNRYCPCNQYNKNDEDVFPLESRLARGNKIKIFPIKQTKRETPMRFSYLSFSDYYMNGRGGEDESSSEDSTNDATNLLRPYMIKHGFLSKGKNYKDGYYNKLRMVPPKTSAVDETLRALRARGRRKLELPIEDLELYRTRAKKILQNAEDILEKIKMEEEKRNSDVAGYFGTPIKELTSRIQSNPRNNDNNEFIRILKKNLGWAPFQKDNNDHDDDDKFSDSIKSYFLDPYEKARQLTEESAKRLSTFLLQNLSKLGKKDEGVTISDKAGIEESLKALQGQVPQNKESIQSDDLKKENVQDDRGPPTDSDLQTRENEQTNSSGYGNYKPFGNQLLTGPLKKIVEDIIKEQQAQMTEFSDKINREKEEFSKDFNDDDESDLNMKKLQEILADNKTKEEEEEEIKNVDAAAIENDKMVQDTNSDNLEKETLENQNLQEPRDDTSTNVLKESENNNGPEKLTSMDDDDEEKLKEKMVESQNLSNEFVDGGEKNEEELKKDEDEEKVEGDDKLKQVMEKFNDDNDDLLSKKEEKILENLKNQEGGDDDDDDDAATVKEIVKEIIKSDEQEFENDKTNLKEEEKENFTPAGSDNLELKREKIDENSNEKEINEEDKEDSNENLRKTNENPDEVQEEVVVSNDTPTENEENVQKTIEDDSETTNAEDQNVQQMRNESSENVTKENNKNDAEEENSEKAEEEEEEEATGNVSNDENVQQTNENVEEKETITKDEINDDLQGDENLQKIKEESNEKEENNMEEQVQEILEELNEKEMKEEDKTLNSPSESSSEYENLQETKEENPKTESIRIETESNEESNDENDDANESKNEKVQKFFDDEIKEELKEINDAAADNENADLKNDSSEMDNLKSVLKKEKEEEENEEDGEKTQQETINDEGNDDDDDNLNKSTDAENVTGMKDKTIIHEDVKETEKIINSQEENEMENVGKINKMNDENDEMNNNDNENSNMENERVENSNIDKEITESNLNENNDEMTEAEKKILNFVGKEENSREENDDDVGLTNGEKLIGTNDDEFQSDDSNEEKVANPSEKSSEMEKPETLEEIKGKPMKNEESDEESDLASTQNKEIDNEPETNLDGNSNEQDENVEKPNVKSEEEKEAEENVEKTSSLVDSDDKILSSENFITGDDEKESLEKLQSNQNEREKDEQEVNDNDLKSESSAEERIGQQEDVNKSVSDEEGKLNELYDNFYWPSSEQSKDWLSEDLSKKNNLGKKIPEEANLKLEEEEEQLQSGRKISSSSHEENISDDVLQDPNKSDIQETQSYPSVGDETLKTEKLDVLNDVASEEQQQGMDDDDTSRYVKEKSEFEEPNVGSESIVNPHDDKFVIDNNSNEFDISSKEKINAENIMREKPLKKPYNERIWDRHGYRGEPLSYYDDLPEAEPYEVPKSTEDNVPPFLFKKTKTLSSGESSLNDDNLLKFDPAKPKTRQIIIPKAIEKIIKDLNDNKNDGNDDIDSIQNLDTESIDKYIDKIDKAEYENSNLNDDTDCKKECSCVEEVDMRSRKIGRYEIVKDFLHWVKDLRMNRVLSDD